MKKLVLFLLLSVVAVESGYAFIFGGGAWRRHYRRHRRGLLSCVEKQAVGPPELQDLRDAVDRELEAAYGGDVWR
tara:strand:+ start:270 stop:494 length:225 start_codon:yes stop_codon:yes gene_type:complete